MKNNLFLTTALVATAFVASNAMATSGPTEVSTWSGLSEALAAGQEIKVMDNIAAENSVKIVSKNNTVNLQENKLSINGQTNNTVNESIVTLDAANLTINNGTLEFKNNTADWGALGAVSSPITIATNAVTFDGNKSKTHGAGLYYKDQAGTAGVTFNSDVTFNNNEIISSSTSGSGAGVFVSGGNVSFLGENNTFTNNEMNATIASSRQYKVGGGAIANQSYWNENNHSQAIDATMVIGKDANSVNTFSNNSSSTNGGAIMNRAVDDDGNAYMTINGTSTFSENSAALNGGAIYNVAQNGHTAQLNLSNATFTDNTATTNGGAIYNEGEITFSGTNTFEGNKAGSSANDIYNTGTITFNGDVTLDGGISGDAGNMGSVTFASGTSVNVKANETFIKNNNVTNGGATLNLNLDNGYTGTYVMVDGGTLNNEFTIAENTLYNITATDTKGTYDVSKKSSAEVATETGASQNQAAAVTAITNGEGNNATFNAIAENISDLMQSGSAVGVQLALEAAETLAPEVAPVVLQTATENVGQIFSAVSARLSGGAATAPNSRGMASGDSVFENGAVWAQGLYNHSKLNDTRKAKGYKADSNGLAFGFEKQINENVKAGIGYAYTKTDVDGHNRDLDIDTHTALVYGEYKPSAWFVNAMASYSWSDYDEDKRVLGQKITGDYDAQSYALQAMSGYEFAYDNTIFTPEAGLRYIHISQDGHKDTAGQYVYGSEVDTLTGIAGLRVEQAYALDNGWTLRPSARFAVTYDIANDDGNSAALLANGTAYSVKGEAMDRFGMEADFALTADITDNASVSLGYQGKFRDDYKDHTGLLNLKYNF